MVYVYVIQSEPSGRRYVGIAQDLNRRLKEHNGGQVNSTKTYAPWKLVYQETFTSHAEARPREKYLKSSAGRRYLKKSWEKVSLFAEWLNCKSCLLCAW
ncbi:MAG: GIY-YIG nuclease family protein [Lewinellaceae bacterium]|nr:GIY-YIG nuclease family protein [Lewinellaceae bacterium]